MSRAQLWYQFRFRRQRQGRDLHTCWVQGTSTEDARSRLLAADPSISGHGMELITAQARFDDSAPSGHGYR